MTINKVCRQSPCSLQAVSLYVDGPHSMQICFAAYSAEFNGHRLFIQPSMPTMQVCLVRKRTCTLARDVIAQYNRCKDIHKHTKNCYLISINNRAQCLQLPRCRRDMQLANHNYNTKIIHYYCCGNPTVSPLQYNIATITIIL